MESKDVVLDVMRDLGRKEASALRESASELSGTEIIAQERAVPAWNASQDYTSWPAGSPVSDEGQVWTLIIPHRASDYVGRPSTLRALWGLAHTTDPARAKPWVDPYGTSGMYKKDECYKAEDGKIYRCITTETNFDANAMPSYWEEVVQNGR